MNTLGLYNYMYKHDTILFTYKDEHAHRPVPKIQVFLVNVQVS